MKKAVFGKTGLMVTPVAMGGIPIMRLSEKQAVEVVRKVLAMGVNFIDTATGYGDSEKKIGVALEGRKRRDIVIASKSPAQPSTAPLNRASPPSPWRKNRNIDAI